MANEREKGKQRPNRKERRKYMERKAEEGNSAGRQDGCQARPRPRVGRDNEGLCSPSSYSRERAEERVEKTEMRSLQIRTGTSKAMFCELPGEGWA